jgi:hypothetical protein
MRDCASIGFATMTYIPSALSSDTEPLRERTFTRWISRELLQAATDFCKNIGLYAIYSECGPDHLERYRFWNLPRGARIEIRTGRTKEQFIAFDQKNIERNFPLLSLHINENAIHSAVWISPDHLETATAVLAVYGITPSRRVPEE